jgi:hypothetical protein
VLQPLCASWVSTLCAAVVLRVTLLGGSVHSPDSDVPQTQTLLGAPGTRLVDRFLSGPALATVKGLLRFFRLSSPAASGETIARPLHRVEGQGISSSRQLDVDIGDLGLPLSDTVVDTEDILAVALSNLEVTAWPRGRDVCATMFLPCFAQKLHEQMNVVALYSCVLSSPLNATPVWYKFTKHTYLVGILRCM